MNQQLKAKWVRALMSGEYTQGESGLLCDGIGYCCLGVLRAVANPKDKYSLDKMGHFLAPVQERRFGLDFEIQNALADLNDARVPFEVIAGLIHEAL